MISDNPRDSAGIDHVYVYLDDWCPACMEYKVTLNKVKSEQNIDIEFSLPPGATVHSIPTTYFLKGSRYYTWSGFMPYSMFMSVYRHIAEFEEE